jgi:hypothetical protein
MKLISQQIDDSKIKEEEMRAKLLSKIEFDECHHQTAGMDAGGGHGS